MLLAMTQSVQIRDRGSRTGERYVSYLAAQLSAFVVDVTRHKSNRLRLISRLARINPFADKTTILSVEVSSHISLVFVRHD